ncbi:hypothetical protein EVAR_96988_1 [Eumeta japonica]|uniref:Uncharacterized protein n=1 Tax=Eumeta variegata TaxID=151549 RepID=A0A4C1VG63_EUMVA|nr:hypothetical protein EVAR_96988_1 [Eumeta japonica]
MCSGGAQGARPLVSLDILFLLRHIHVMLQLSCSDLIDQMNSARVSQSLQNEPTSYRPSLEGRSKYKNTFAFGGPAMKLKFSPKFYCCAASGERRANKIEYSTNSLRGGLETC